MLPPGILRLKVMAVRVLAAEVDIVGSELTILYLFVTEPKSLMNSEKSWTYKRKNTVFFNRIEDQFVVNVPSK